MAQSAKRRRRLSDGYSFACFRANAIVRGVFGDPDVRIVRLDRRSKKRFAAVVGGSTTAGTIGGGGRVRARPTPGFWMFFSPQRVAGPAPPPAARNADTRAFLSANSAFP